MQFRKLSFAAVLVAGAGSLGATGEQVQGTVVAVDAATRTFVVDEGETSRAYPVEPGDLKVPYTGRPITATLVPTEDGSVLRSIWPADEDLRASAELINAPLHRRARKGRPHPPLKAGDTINAALWDQSARLRQLTDFVGEPVILNFIFTRCQDAQMCPAATFKMNQLRQELQTRNLPGQLITISFDPAHDTPGVLHLYGEQRGLDFSRHHLLTGSPAVIQSLLEAFGVLTRHEDGTIVHTMTTALLDAEGRVAWLRFGADWQPQEFIERIARSPAMD